MLLEEYAMAGYSREELVFHKDKLYEMGGTIHDPIQKWKNK